MHRNVDPKQESTQVRNAPCMRGTHPDLRESNG